MAKRLETLAAASADLSDCTGQECMVSAAK
jgi:hypothetical protein